MLNCGILSNLNLNPMKKLTLVTTLLFCIVFSFAQTDIEIATSLIGRPYSELEKKFEEYNLEYYITADEGQNVNIYITIDNSVRLWEIKHRNLYREKTVHGRKVVTPVGIDLIAEIFVRYRHSNLNDLRHFHSYEIPENTKYREYEKSNGDKLSHLRVTQK